VKQCPDCGGRVETPRDKVKRNVFVWTASSLFFWIITVEIAEWTLTWWIARPHVVSVLAVMSVAASYWWVRLIKGTRS
jgi:hypothetical protein